MLKSTIILPLCIESITKRLQRRKCQTEGRKTEIQSHLLKRKSVHVAIDFHGSYNIFSQNQIWM